MSNRFFVILLTIIVLFFGIFFVTKNKDGSSGSNGGVQPTNHVIGKGQKQITLVEYGDYQCPFCGQYYPILKQVQQKYDKEIFFQFRNFPLTQVHHNAFVGARAAEAADKQGKFWPMHDLLYENQQAWSAASDPNSFFISYANQLGLDVEKFKTDMASSEVNDVINADIEAGQKLSVNSTPTFFLNDQKLDPSPQSVQEFSKLIDAAIAAQKS